MHVKQYIKILKETKHDTLHVKYMTINIYIIFLLKKISMLKVFIIIFMF